MRTTDLPLSGIRVVELGHIVAGPSAGMTLAELGAQVTKVETIDAGDSARNQGNNGTTFFSWNRAKRSTAINLKTPEGQEIFRRLVSVSDVVLDNFKPGALDRLGLGYEWAARVNPGIIYCSISGFLPGLYEDRPYLDELAQMEGGLAFITGPPGNPLRAGAPVIDIGAGAYGAIGILSLLLRRVSTGVGGRVRAGLLETTAFYLHQHIARPQLTGERARPRMSRVSGVGKQMGWGIYDLFEVADGDIFIAVVSDRQWEALCTVLRCEEFLEDSRLDSNRQRAESRELFISVIAERVAEFNYIDLAHLLRDCDVPYAPVNRPEELMDDAHMRGGGYIRELPISDSQGIQVPALPVVIDEVIPREWTAPPRHGEHTDEVLTELGYSESEIASMHKSHAVRASSRRLLIDSEDWE